MNTHQLLEYFSKRGATRIAGGCFGTVFSLKDNPYWIIKHAQNDGTRNYLEWVQWRNQKRRPMKGMPEIDFLHSLSGDNRYFVAMKRYQRLDTTSHQWAVRATRGDRLREMPIYLRKLIEAFEEETGARANDTHSGNFMMDGKTIILTDPSSADYNPPSNLEVFPESLLCPVEAVATLSDIPF